MIEETLTADLCHCPALFFSKLSIKYKLLIKTKIIVNRFIGASKEL
jgi:hypothetical protein